MGLIGLGRHDEARVCSEAKEITLSDVFSVLNSASMDLHDVAGIAEELAERIAGPDEAYGAGIAIDPPEPSALVDRLNVSAGKFQTPTSRIRRALNRIDRRLPR